MESDYPDSEPTGLHRAQTYNTSSDDSGSEDERELLPDLLKGILRDIDHATIRFPLDDFTQQRCDELASHGTGKGASSNALHLLVFDLTLPKMVTTSALKELVTFLVQHPNKLMERKDHQGYTPLMRAIEAKKMDDMVGWMCDAHPNIDAVLAICKDKRENCLHVAVQKRHACLSKLIEKASPKTVAARDSKGNTPLHWAAEYKRCRNDTWLSVVKQLVAKGDDIVKNSVEGDLNNAGLSPYLRHIESRMHDEARREIDTSQDMVRTKDMLEGRLPFRQLSRESGEESAAFESLSASRPANPEKTSRYNRSTAAYRDTRMESRSPLHLALRGGLRFIPPEGLEEKQARKLKAQDERSVNHKKSRVDKKVAESVQQFLKLHYLRSRSENDCRDILYHSDFTPGKYIKNNLHVHKQEAQSESPAGPDYISQKNGERNAYHLQSASYRLPRSGSES